VYFPLELCPQTLDDVATVRWRCDQQNSSTVEHVDYTNDSRARHDWMQKYYCTLVYRNPLTPILTCPNHILRTLLLLPTAQNYSLRNRPHNRQLPDRISRITDCNFTVRMLYRNMYYWLLYILNLRFVLFMCTTAVWRFAINEYVMLCYVINSICCGFVVRLVFTVDEILTDIARRAVRLR